MREVYQHTNVESDFRYCGGFTLHRTADININITQIQILPMRLNAQITLKATTLPVFHSSLVSRS